MVRWFFCEVLRLQGLIKDAFTALASDGGDQSSLADLQQSHVVEKADFHKSLVPSEERLTDASRRIQKVDHHNDILADLASKVDEAEGKLKSFEQQSHFLEKKASEQCNQLFEKDASWGGYQGVLLF